MYVGPVEGEGGHCKHQALHTWAAVPGLAHATTHVGSVEGEEGHCYEQTAHIVRQLFPGKLPLELHYRFYMWRGKLLE